MVVLLPDPLGPITPVMLPASTAKLASRIALTPRKDLLSWWTCRIGVIGWLCARR
jgi:hypothetical protein